MTWGVDSVPDCRKFETWDGLILILGSSRSPLYAVEIEEMIDRVAAMEAVRNQVPMGSAEVDSRERRSDP